MDFTQYLISGYAIFIMVVVYVVASLVITEVIIEVLRNWDESNRKRKQNESNRGKKM